jgi:hypothetical protein
VVTGAYVFYLLIRGTARTCDYFRSCPTSSDAG